MAKLILNDEQIDLIKSRMLSVDCEITCLKTELLQHQARVRRVLLGMPEGQESGNNTNEEAKLVE